MGADAELRRGKVREVEADLKEADQIVSPPSVCPALYMSEQQVLIQEF